MILKPDAGCQGKGIFLTKSLDQCLDVDGMIAQQYLPAPLLVDGYKFDMRLYVLVLSCSPLRVLLFKEGLARFCTEKYKAPTEVCQEHQAMPRMAPTLRPRTASPRHGWRPPSAPLTALASRPLALSPLRSQTWTIHLCI